MLPIKNEIDNINVGLEGWSNDQTILSISYLPNSDIVSCIYELLHNNKEISNGQLTSLSKQKAHCVNFQSFIIKEPIYHYSSYVKETRDFIAELKYEINQLDKVFEKINFSTEAKHIFHLFVSRTSPVIFNMGFADAINHASQVTKKCIVEAYKRNSNDYELLQAAIVGWIHDPKVPLKFSWSNLTTHPVIACSIALKFLNQSTLKDAISKYLLKYFNNKDISPEKFINGIAEALAINNDSEYVLTNGILYRPNWASGPSEPGGIIDQILSLSDNELKSLGIEESPEQLANKVKENAIYWFENSAEGKKITIFESSIKTILSHIKLETGIRGIYIKAFEKSFKSVAPKYNFPTTTRPEKLFDQIINGEILNGEFIIDIRNSLQSSSITSEQIFLIPTVSGTSLFCYNIELENPTISALALEISDPLLLSPHKLLIEGVKSTVIDQIKDFLDSCIKNIIYLPNEAKSGGKIWQRDLYVSILQTADDLTGQNQLEQFVEKLNKYDNIYKPFKTNSSQNIDIVIIDDQINLLSNLITDPNSWTNVETKENYANIKRKDPANNEFLDKLFYILKENYEIAAQKSPEMFGLITVEI
ncbi:MAG: hypothetical protein AB1782_00135 [Cyanobacteriota bacterium]